MLRITPAAALFCLFAFEPLTPAVAQQVLGPAPIIGGIQMNCGGVNTVVQNISDIAMARPGWIILHPNFFQLPAALQRFMYGHECAHHLQPSGGEPGADCLAIKVGRDQGWFRQEDIRYLIQYFGNSPGDWTHWPGPPRVSFMIGCFNTR